jgi:threonine dehydrogenase-like Zn-dependent dehydrogenase
LDEATLLLDIIGTGGHAFRRAQLVHTDIQSVGIAGAGPIGLGVLAMAKLILGAEIPVFISDTIPYRLQLGERLGGIPVHLGSGTLSQAVSARGSNRVDLAVDTSGRSAARQDCLRSLSKRGVLVCVGHGEGLNLEISPDLIAPERAVLGSEYFLFRDLTYNLEILRQHRSYLSQVITHRFPLGEIQQAFETFFAGETGKVVVVQ